MDVEYNIRYAQATQHYKAGANWFYWIAGLSIITSAHGFALFFLIRGFMAGREMLALEKTMAQQAVMPQTEPAL